MTHRVPSPTSVRRQPLLSTLCTLVLLLLSTQACGAENTDAEAAMDGAETAAVQTADTPATTPSPTANAAAETPEPFDPSTLPAVVARVDDQEISRDRLMEEAQAARVQLVQSGVPESATRTKEFYAQALDQIVADILLYQEARSEGLVPSDEEVAQRLETIRSSVPEGGNFEEMLQTRGMTEAGLTEELRRSGALQKIVETKIAPRVSVDESQARTFYDQNLEQMRMPPRVKVRHILLEVPQDASEEARQAARDKAKDLRAQIADGGDFSALAREHSQDDGSAQQGGELPWLMPGQTVPAFDQAVFALDPGQLGPVVESRFGYHVVQTLDKQPEQTAPFEQVKERILNRLRQEQAQQQLHAHVDELRTAHEVEIHI